MDINKSLKLKKKSAVHLISSLLVDGGITVELLNKIIFIADYNSFLSVGRTTFGGSYVKSSNLYALKELNEIIDYSKGSLELNNNVITTHITPNPDYFSKNSMKMLLNAVIFSKSDFDHSIFLSKNHNELKTGDDVDWYHILEKNPLSVDLFNHLNNR